jgi:hypothetical protein
MRCVFCKKDSSTSQSVEHIMPESLGNKTYVLPLGVVCDNCNSYFATKIERPLLEQYFFKNLRFRNFIESKKGKIPTGIAIIPKTYKQGEVTFTKDNCPIVNIDFDSCMSILNGEVDHFIIPIVTEPEKSNRIVSRFICKVGFEALTHRLLNYAGWLDYITDEVEFDPVRNYVRYNISKESWIYNIRRIYSENEIFYGPNGKIYDRLYEYDFLRTEHNELYFILCLKGYEFVVNMAGSSLDGYLDWLLKNNNQSPLYVSSETLPDSTKPEFKKINFPLGK